MANRNLGASNLVILTWGNASAYDPVEKIVAIKPSGVPFDKLSENDIVLVDLNGRVVEGNLRPSSDLPTHIEIYRAFPSICGIVHTHSPFAVAWAQAQRPIPCYGTTHADSFHGDIPVTRQFVPSDFREYEKKTGEIIVEEMEGKNPEEIPAILVRSHGPFAFGRTVEEALDNATILEEVAKMAFFTEAILGEKKIIVSPELLQKHYSRKHGKDAYYGQKKR